MKNKNNEIKNILFGFMMLVFILGIAVAYEFSKRDLKKTGTDFSKCSVLKNDCIDKSCDLFYLCNDSDHKSCKVYDCGENYGIETADNNGTTEKKYREKFDLAKAKLDVKTCGGRLAVLEKNECNNEKASAKVQLFVGGNCGISGFTMNIDGKPSMATFKKENDYYIVTANICGTISDIMAVGEGGVQIKESY